MKVGFRVRAWFRFQGLGIRWKPWVEVGFMQASWSGFRLQGQVGGRDIFVLHCSTPLYFTVHHCSTVTVVLLPDCHLTCCWL